MECEIMDKIVAIESFEQQSIQSIKYLVSLKIDMHWVSLSKKYTR